MSFQTSVSVQPAPAVAGDFASANPRFSVDAGPGGLVAGPNGVTVGRFAWLSASSIDPNGAPTIANNFGSGPVGGFVHREQQGLITSFLADSGMVIPPGFMVTLMKGGSFWVKNEGTTEALFGQTCYAAFANGAANFAASGAPLSASGTASIAASTFSVTGVVSGNTLTVSAVGSGTVVPGAVISGTGVATGTAILSQVSGTAGGVGVYTISIPEQATTASETISGTYGTMTVTAIASGAYGVGDSLTGTGVTAGTTITALGTGTGGLGTYIVNLTQTTASTTITAALGVATKFIAMSAGAPGELVNISDHPLG
jgi:hypothetical protein